jgi:hypothetical protein
LTRLPRGSFAWPEVRRIKLRRFGPLGKTDPGGEENPFPRFGRKLDKYEYQPVALTGYPNGE